jgi:hypothetical protein
MQWHHRFITDWADTLNPSPLNPTCNKFSRTELSRLPLQIYFQCAPPSHPLVLSRTQHTLPILPAFIHTRFAALHLKPAIMKLARRRTFAPGNVVSCRYNTSKSSAFCIVVIMLYSRYVNVIILRCHDLYLKCVIILYFILPLPQLVQHSTTSNPGQVWFTYLRNVPEYTSTVQSSIRIHKSAIADAQSWELLPSNGWNHSVINPVSILPQQT